MCNHAIQLQPTQLCDLLNYVLSRPAGHPQSVEVFVVKTWTTRRGRSRIQRWCEAILRFHGISIRRNLPNSVGRPPCLVPPNEIRGLCGWREIAQLQSLKLR